MNANVNVKSFLFELFEEYKKSRKNKKRRMYRFSSRMKRAVGCGQKYAELLGQEVELFDYYKRYCLYPCVEKYNLNDKDLEVVVQFLSSFKDRLAYRSTFLVIFASLFALGSLYGSIVADPVFIFINILTLGMIVFERHNNNENAAAAQELIHIINISKSSFD